MDRRIFWVILIAAGTAMLAAGVVLALLGSGFSAFAVPLLIFGIPIAVFGLGLAAKSAGEHERRTLTLEDQIELLTQEASRQRDAVDQFASGLNMMILVVDAKHRVIYANRQARSAFGMSRAFGQTLLAQTFSRELEEMVRSAFESGEVRKGELGFNHPESRIGQVQVWAEPPAFDRCFISIVDITSLRRLERTRQDFVANVSHELRTPMATIRVMAETLQYEKDDPEIQERYLTAIIREVDRLAQVTADLLTLSMVESRGVKTEAVCLGQVLQAVVEQAAPKAKEKGIDLILASPSQTVIPANKNLVHQVFANLVDNALNYTIEGSVTVDVAESEKELTVSVTDTGIGISSEHTARVFERFYRVDKGRARAKGGTGLGLSIVKHIIESHGGRVWVESELNQGTTFFVALPKETPGQGAPESDEEAD